MREVEEDRRETEREEKKKVAEGVYGGEERRKRGRAKGRGREERERERERVEEDERKKWIGLLKK